MTSYKIELSHDFTGNTVYNTFFETSSNKDPFNFKTTNRNKIVEYLKSEGVLEDEINFAIDHMVEFGHNVGTFGIFGTFISSWYEGAPN